MEILKRPSVAYVQLVDSDCAYDLLETSPVIMTAFSTTSDVILSTYINPSRLLAHICTDISLFVSYINSYCYKFGYKFSDEFMEAFYKLRDAEGVLNLVTALPDEIKLFSKDLQSRLPRRVVYSAQDLFNDPDVAYFIESVKVLSPGCTDGFIPSRDFIIDDIKCDNLDNNIDAHYRAFSKAVNKFGFTLALTDIERFLKDGTIFDCGIDVVRKCSKLIFMYYIELFKMWGVY